MPESNLDRRDFIRLGAAVTAAGLVPRELLASPPAAFQIEDAGVAELSQRMASGELSSRQLAELYLNRIDSIDRGGPRINCVLETNPEALDIADRLDAERRAGKVRGPMHGIPVLIKDNIGTADRMQTTAGSLALLDARPAADASIVARMREAGCVILGKTNLSEWANFRSTRSISGWSGRGGLCRNPYALDRNTSGSSSGSGGAGAAALATVTVGTETDGSIVSPANSCGLVGLKPTIGLVSRAGIIPIAHTQDTAGPMTRSVADAAALLTVLAGSDPRDTATARADVQRSRDYTAFLKNERLTGVRIGVVRERLMGYNTHADRVAEDALKALKELGAVIIDSVKPPAGLASDLGNAEYEVLLYEYKADLEAYFASIPGAQVKTLADLIAFNDRNREREMPYFGQEIVTMAAAKGPLTTPAYKTALAKCRRIARTEGIDAMMTAHRLDALFAPTGTPAWVTDLVNGDSVGGGSSTLAAVAGYPHITVPAGFAMNLPVGVSFFGRAWSEPVLLRIAYAFEQSTKARRAPKYLPSAL
jgi:amidase